MSRATAAWLPESRSGVSPPMIEPAASGARCHAHADIRRFGKVTRYSLEPSPDIFGGRSGSHARSMTRSPSDARYTAGACVVKFIAYVASVSLPQRGGESHIVVCGYWRRLSDGQRWFRC